MSVKVIKKCLLIIAGSVSLLLAIFGIFIPLLPTTPFLLLASFCYLRSSQRLYNWLINHRIFGTYIYNYLTYRAIDKKTRMGALIFLWASLSFSIFIVPNLHLRIFLITVGVGVSVHILTLKTMNRKIKYVAKQQ